MIIKNILITFLFILVMMGTSYATFKVYAPSNEENTINSVPKYEQMNFNISSGVNKNIEKQNSIADINSSNNSNNSNIYNGVGSKIQKDTKNDIKSIEGIGYESNTNTEKTRDKLNNIKLEMQNKTNNNKQDIDQKSKEYKYQNGISISITEVGKVDQNTKIALQKLLEEKFIPK